jgi:hypothetical protein
MRTIMDQMAWGQYYAVIYADFVSKKIELEGKETTEAFKRLREDAMPSFYAAVLVLFVKVRARSEKTAVGSTYTSFVLIKRI